MKHLCGGEADGGVHVHWQSSLVTQVVLSTALALIMDNSDCPLQRQSQSLVLPYSPHESLYVIAYVYIYIYYDFGWRICMHTPESYDYCHRLSLTDCELWTVDLSTEKQPYILHVDFPVWFFCFSDCALCTKLPAKEDPTSHDLPLISFDFHDFAMHKAPNRP